jgi:hypothetical protein
MELTTVTLVADVPPVVTVDAAGKPFPVRLTNVPPLVAPGVGEIVVTLGEGAVLLVTSKLSKMTFPGGLVSTCEVPSLSSKRTDEVETEEGAGVPVKLSELSVRIPR